MLAETADSDPIDAVRTGLNTIRSGQQEPEDHRERLAAIGQVAAGVAHDLNNVVAAISLHAELLEKLPGIDADGRGYVAVIREQGRRASSLVWQVLDFANRSSLQLVDIDLAAFLVQLLPALHRMKPDDIDLVLRHDDQPYLARADPSGFGQIVMAVVSNAVEAIAGPGQITITVLRPSTDWDESPGHDGPLGRRCVRIEITDTGSGMDAEVLARAFEPFFSTKGQGEANGLGLALVRGLIGQHEGHIDLASVVGRGTTATIWLPEPPIDVIPPHVSGVHDPQGRGGERLLVVDDDPAVRRAMVTVLEMLGYVPTAAESGEEAFALLEDGAPAISAVISDIMMPGMGGDTLAGEVAARWPAIPVILVSGYPGPGAPDPGAIGAGALVPSPALRLQKPFTSHQMAITLQKALHPSDS